MQYLNKSFTLPTSGNKVSERQYGYATLTKAKFIEKYGEDAEGYTADEVSAEKVSEAAEAAKPHVQFHPTPPAKE